jgi:N-acyl-D-aspartate/D-glutamate deacylase
MLVALLLAADAALQPFIKIDAPAVVLDHVRVIDGTGAPPREDQSLAIVGGKFAAQAPPNAQRLDLAGRTVFPGLVGMHAPKLADSVRGPGGIR